MVTIYDNYKHQADLINIDSNHLCTMKLNKKF
jgi:hypothetical protein